jgi:hypothetical protein
MVKDLKIRYTIQSGSLPNGISLDPDTGLISGSTGFDSLGVGPVWASPQAGNLASYDENTSFNTVNFQANTTKSPVIYNIVQGYIPWGLTFNSTTGTLSGNIAALKLRINEQASTSDGPIWSTPFGRLANYDEGSTASINLSVTPRASRTIKNYALATGYLPFGLKLNPATGVISGVTAVLKNPGQFVDVPKLPVPVWNTPAGSMGVFDEHSTFSGSVAATPASGRSMNKYLIRDGALPFGLKMNLSTGAITGTIVDLKTVEPVFIDPAFNPTIADKMVVQGANATVVDGGSLGTYTKGQAVSIGFIASAKSGRTIRNYALVSGYLPFGLKLNAKFGTISGNVLNNDRTRAGLYTFTLRVVDKGDTQFRQNSIDRTYSITVQ